MRKISDNPGSSESRKLASKMPNLPRLECDTPATTRIEIYTPRGGMLHGDLDGVIRTCDGHKADFLEVLSWSPGEATAHCTPIPEGHSGRCGSGFDYVAKRPLDGPPAAAAVLGEDHPIVKVAIEALTSTVDGQLPVDAISRDRAAHLLDSWEHRGELSDREVAAILSWFPEVVGEASTEPDPVITSIVQGLAGVACGRPATTHIEVHAPSDDEDEVGALQLSYYMCAEHSAAAVEVVAGVAFTATQIPATAHCGAGGIYTGVAFEELYAPNRRPEVNLIVKAAAAWLRSADTVPGNEAEADSLLRHWAHYPEMTSLEIQAVVTSFPEGAEADEEEPVKDPSFSALAEVYRLGQVHGERVGQQVSRDTLDLLQRLDTRLRNAAKECERAHAEGYVDGLSAAFDKMRVHAFTVEADEDEADKFTWRCACKWVTIQYPIGTIQTPIQIRLMEHVAQATEVDARTARAFDTDTCQCPSEAGHHRHKVYFRRMASTGEVAEIVVDSSWTGERMELLCWPLTKLGVSQTARWVSEFAAQWEDESPVTHEDLIRRAARWLR